MKTSLLLHCVLEYGFSCLFSLSQEASNSMSSLNQTLLSLKLMRMVMNMRHFPTAQNKKNWQGGIDTADGPKEKRMYAIPDLGQKCPVNSLKLFLAKTDPNATSLFNHCVKKKALSSPEEEDVWFSNVPVKQYQFSRFMSDISKNAKCSTSYTAHCLRATAIQGMNDAGFEIRHIMHMSGHKNESSVRSYNRDCSTAQKKQMSDILNGLTLKPQTTNCSVIPHTAPNPESMSVDEFASSAAFTVPRALSMQSSHFLSSGFMSNSTFNNCTFKFEK